MIEDRKNCGKCGKNLSRESFYKDKSKPDGLQSNCIPCRRKVKGIPEREKRRQIESERREYSKSIQKSFKVHWRKHSQKWTGSEIYKEWAKRIHIERGYARDKANPEKRREINRRYRENNREKIKRDRKAYEVKNRDKLLANKREWNRKWRAANKDNPLAIAQKRVRDRTRKAFKAKKWQKRSKTNEMLGCSRDHLVQHIESQFVKGMGWHNRDKWHIDHIVPLASAQTIESLEKLAHFSNLRPIWAEENLAKADKIIDCQPELAIRLS